MKIVIVTQNAPLYLATFLDRFLRRIGSTEHQVHSIVVFSPVFKKSILAELKERYRYYGFFDFIRMMCLIVWNKLLAKLANTVSCLGCYSVQNILKKYNLSQFKINSPNDQAFLDYLKDNAIDVVISIASPKIFKQPLLNTPKKGCINYHTGMLPRYRGRQPLFWALLHNESQVGITIHEMDEALDNGPIIVQKTVPVTSEDSLHTLYLKTIHAGPEALAEALEKLVQDDPIRLENNPNQATYFSFPTQDAVKQFRQNGKRFF